MTDLKVGYYPGCSLQGSSRDFAESLHQRVATLAGLLLVPYFLWVSFAGVLNWALFRLNR